MGTRVGRIARLVLVAGVVVAGAVASAVPAIAKMPAFDLEVSSDRVAPGETVAVRVTIYQDRERSEVARGFGNERLEGLVGVYAAEALTGGEWDPLVQHDLLTLYQVGPGVFEGNFRAPDEGSVVVAPFPGVLGYDPEDGTRLGYPAPITVTVGSPSPPSPWWLVAPLLAVVLGTLTVRRVRLFR